MRQLGLFDLPSGSRSDAGPAAPLGAATRRCAILNGQQVTWELRRGRRRSIGFLIDHRGLRISAPRAVTLAEIERAMLQKADWIVRKLAEWRELATRRERLAPRWEDGATVRVLGETLVVRIRQGARGITVSDGELRIGLPAGADAARLEKRGQAWLQQRAREVFAERIPLFAARLGRAPSRWALSSARTRWGSCSRDGSIRLNWRLVHCPLDVVDYVVAHELAHLRELNHSPRFWAIVAELCPDFERARAWLRQFPEDAPPV
ncbi:MAG: M48 family metallopeptidase [Gammaproteobacteria bacterium]